VGLWFSRFQGLETILLNSWVWGSWLTVAKKTEQGENPERGALVTEGGRRRNLFLNFNFCRCVGGIGGGDGGKKDARKALRPRAEGFSRGAQADFVKPWVISNQSMNKSLVPGFFFGLPPPPPADAGAGRLRSSVFPLSLPLGFSMLLGSVRGLPLGERRLLMAS